jgi:hypothetical protein
MRFCSEDRTCIVETKLVEKRTFLELEPHGTDFESHEECPGRRARAFSDTLLDCRLNTIELKPRANSVTSCETVEDSEGVVGSCSSSSCTDSEDDSETQQTQHMPCQIPKPTSFQHGEPLYYYVALPGTPLWTQFMGSYAAPVSPDIRNDLHKAELEARAAEFQLAAARLKAAARKVEAATQEATTIHMSATTKCPAVACNTSQTLLKEGRGNDVATSKLELGHTQDTTLMLRNIPNDYTRTMLLELLDSEGLVGRYDFVYLPVDFHRKSSLGYAFMNLVTHEDAQKAMDCLHGFRDWKVASQKICEVVWGEPLQGLSAHVERYRSSPVMHSDVPDEFKPILLKNGERVSFPPPTKRIRAPRSKCSVRGHGQ